MKRCLSLILMACLLVSPMSASLSEEDLTSGMDSIPVVTTEATPEPTPTTEATPEPTPTTEATPEPTPTTEATPEPTIAPEDTPALTVTPTSTPKATPTPDKAAILEQAMAPATEQILSRVSAPISLTVTDNSITSLKLNWSAVSGATGGYRIEKSTSRNSGYTVVETVSGTARTVGGLTCGTTYYFRVAAIDTSSGVPVYSDYSPVGSGMPRPLAPTKPTCVVTDISKIQITWTASSGATGYEIYRGANSATPTLLTTIGSASTVTYTDSTAVMGQAYTYYIRAFWNASATYVYSAASPSSTLECLPPPPTITAATFPSVNSVQLTWTAVSGASGYVVYRDTGDGRSYVEITSSVTATTYTDSGLIPGQTNKYKVATYVTVEGVKVVGDASAMKSVEAAVPTPSDLKVQSTSTDTLTVSWSAVSQVSGYEVQCRPIGGAYEPTITVTGAVSLVHTGRSGAVSYEYRVRAYITVNQNGTPVNIYSKYSAFVIGVTKPLMPTNLTVTLQSYSELKLSWKGDPIAAGYEIYRSVGTASMKLHQIRPPALNSAYTDKGLTSGANHSYKVRAFKVVNNIKYYSDFSPIVYETPIPLPVTGLQAVSNDATSAKLTWSACSGADGYVIEMKRDGESSYSTAAQVTGNKTLSHVINNLRTGQRVFFRIRAYRNVNGVRVLGKYNALPNANATPVPAKPTGLSITTANEATLTLKWNAVTGASGYQIYQSENGGTFINVATITGTSQTFKNLFPGRTYTYHITPYVTVGTTQLNGVTSSNISKKMMPLMPKSFKATPTSASSNTLTWKAVTFSTSSTLICGYRIDYYDGAAFQLLADLPISNAQQYQDNNVVVGSTKKYRIRSYVINSDGTKVFSNFSLTASAKTLPNPITDLKVTVDSYNQLTLSWTTDSSATNYSIYRSDKSATDANFILITPAPVRNPGSGKITYTDSSLTPGKTYYYKVRPRNVPGGVYGVFSTVKSARPVPNKPQNVRATAWDVERVRVLWDHVPNSNGYNIFYRESSTATLRFLTYVSYTDAKTSGGGCGFTATGLSMNNTYYFSVSAVQNVKGSQIASALSAQASATTRPVAPQNLVATGLSDEQVRLTWNSVSKATGYIVQRASSPTGVYTTIATVPAKTNPSVTLTKQLAGRIFYYRVYAYTTIGSQSSTSDFSTTSATALP